MADDARRAMVHDDDSGFALPLSILLAGAGLAAGAALMYFLDPNLGDGRRTRAIDQIGAMARRTARHGEGWTDDMTQELQAVPHELGYRSSDGPVPDDLIVDRVRSELGHHVRHAGAIEVRATNGVVTLSGPVLADEVAGVLAAVHTIPGVKEVDDRLELHQSSDSIPSLQG